MKNPYRGFRPILCFVFALYLLTFVIGVAVLVTWLARRKRRYLDRQQEIDLSKLRVDEEPSDAPGSLV